MPSDIRRQWIIYGTTLLQRCDCTQDFTPEITQAARSKCIIAVEPRFANKYETRKQYTVVDISISLQLKLELSSLPLNMCNAEQLRDVF